ncbi:uncharacterized protein EMH_0051030 [Eimeria mitis]|uniref:Uncharacterized protein n=1 Tax=Eimeria mitis TaxID=44415 RepID=U6JXV6_9EIME|nr:uncharacterized protein EMH_0051030 [Eimeria mitis]CDJ29596.1 hypothetical protein EMH_0051030 [Eimeria mitis]
MKDRFLSGEIMADDYALIVTGVLFIVIGQVSSSTEERRPVPALIQPTEDEGQVSVREDRRHIATLFSLDAAESQAQKARLQEQLRETSPFRLTEVGGSSSASQSDGVEIIGPPPGQSKRRQRSTLLETIVREHDWEAEEQTFEENIRIYPEQQDQAQEPQAPEASQWHFLASDEEEGDGSKRTFASIQSSRIKSKSHKRQKHHSGTS